MARVRLVRWLGGAGLLAAVMGAPCGIAFLLLPFGLGLSFFSAVGMQLQTLRPYLVLLTAISLGAAWFGFLVDARARREAYGRAAVGARFPRLMVAVTTLLAAGAIVANAATSHAIMELMAAAGMAGPGR